MHAEIIEKIAREVERRSKLREDALKAFSKGNATPQQKNLVEASGFCEDPSLSDTPFFAPSAHLSSVWKHNTEAERKMQAYDINFLCREYGVPVPRDVLNLL